MDGWVDADNVAEGVCLMQAKTLAQRVDAAESLAAAAGLARDSILVDSMDNAAELAFEARPEKLLVVTSNTVLFLSGIGQCV